MPTICACPVPLSLYNRKATRVIYTLSLHDALPIWFGNLHYSTRSQGIGRRRLVQRVKDPGRGRRIPSPKTDRKSTRLNSSHLGISYAVFCLKKKKKRRRTALGEKRL